METFVKKPCKNCPFRNDVTPYLHPERAEKLAYAAQNPYNDFSCHKTTEYAEDLEDMVVGERTLTCAGFLTLMAQIGEYEYIPEGFEPSYDICYIDEYDMIQAYEQEWEKRNKV